MTRAAALARRERGVGAADISPLRFEEIFALVSDVSGDVYPPQVDDVLAHYAMVGHALFAYTMVLPCCSGTLVATALVIDDDPTITQLLCDALAEEYHVQVASSGEEGL